MELADKLRQVMSEHFEIFGNKEFEEVLKEMQGLDLGIFTKPLQRKEIVS